MAATPIAAAVRYNNTTNQHVTFVPVLADPTSPLRTELDAGTDLTGIIPKDGVGDGFSGTEDTITTDDLLTGTTLPMHDGKTYSGAAITFWRSSATTDALKALLSEGTTGYICIFDVGDKPGTGMDVFPVRVGTLQKNRSGAAQWTVNFTFTSVPSENVTVPT